MTHGARPFPSVFETECIIKAHYDPRGHLPKLLIMSLETLVADEIPYSPWGNAAITTLWPPILPLVYALLS